MNRPGFEGATSNLASLFKFEGMINAMPAASIADTDTNAGTSGRRKILGGLFVRKERWGLSWRGRFAVLSALAALAAAVVLEIHPFLAVTNPTHSDYLVVEGWIHYSDFDLAAQVFRNGHYKKLLTSGVQRDSAIKPGSKDNYADYAAEQLKDFGVTDDQSQAVSCWVTHKDRTYNSALAVKKWFERNGIKITSIDVVSEGPHARRSRLLYQKAFGSGVHVGIISLQDPTYDPEHWWRSSEGVREVIGETVAYMYAKFCFPFLRESSRAETTEISKPSAECGTAACSCELSMNSTIPGSSISTRAHDEAGTQKVTEAIHSLLQYCRDNNWAGYDPYDALNSVLLQRTGLYSAKLPRLAATQFLKRSPINLRRLLLVPKEQNPKGIALFATALIKLARQGLADMGEARRMVARLLEMRSAGFERYCWGYNFSWQTRTYIVPRGTPNIICTTFAANALLDAYDQFQDSQFLESAISAGHYLMEGLSRSGDSEASCFSYTPLDNSQIHNANLLGAALLARLHTYKQSNEFLKQALSSTRFSMRLQRVDGSWPYGEGPKQGWIDGFHTGYNLDALQVVQAAAGGNEFEPAMRKGLKFYREHFFTEEGVAKYFHNKVYPIDVHSIAQAMITLVKFKQYDPDNLNLARKVCHWGLDNMRAADGSFFVQRHARFTNKIPYMRWAQSWMLLALSTLSEASREASAPFETQMKTDSDKNN